MRAYSQPYKKNNPRTVRGAVKRGWTVIVPKGSYVEQLSWIGLNIWCEQRMSGYWVSSFQRREFAFENPADAMFFQMKWA